MSFISVRWNQVICFLIAIIDFNMGTKYSV